jgi:Tyrosine-protein kinase ephrin type A/B receptor-like
LFTEPSLDQSTCRCMAGSRDVALSSLAPVCACGPGMNFNMQAGCGACPVNTVNDQTFTLVKDSEVQCTPCDPGFVSNALSTQCIPCPLGTYRSSDFDSCQDCPKGQYSQDPTTAACVDCVSECGGLLETPCPTDNSLVLCSQCPTPRDHSYPNGKRNCTTECLDGYYELEGMCTSCSQFDRISCPAGWIHVQCGKFYDASCVPCANSTMPLNWAVWTYSPLVQDGPNAMCTWGCAEGYTPQPILLPEGLGPVWECVQVGAWSVWDLFTL